MLGDRFGIPVAEFRALLSRKRIEFPSECFEFVFLEGFAILVDEMSRSQGRSLVAKC
jgi:hypothetical protein